MIKHAFALLILMAISQAEARTSAYTRHEIGPWPVVSKLIGYGDRIWFVNSVKGANHNSADLHSIPIRGGSPRYEGHLFSQDAGDPVVHRGLLYWPLEDARTGPGIGAFDVTDGERWEHGLIPTEQAFHNHAMVVGDDGLYAAPSAWKASIARSEDGGETWETVYRHPTPDGRVSRITSLVATDNGVYGALNAPEGHRLIRVDDGSGSSVPDWPIGKRTTSLTVHRGAVHGLVTDGDEAEVWTTDGTTSRLAWTSVLPYRPAALASDGEALWMVANWEGDLTVGRSLDGQSWSGIGTLKGANAFDIAAYQGVIAIGGRGDNGKGVLWMIRPPTEARPAIKTPVPDWPTLTPPAPGDFDWAGAAAHLDERLADPESYARYGDPLRQMIRNLPRRDVPTDFYARRLAAAMPSDTLPMFGNIMLDEMAVMGRWRLYWGMGLARSGKVDPADILRPWDYTPNGPFKFFSTPEIAIWAARWLGQRDHLVLDALVQRLEGKATPLWLKGDAVGALYSLTGQRLGYDATAWRGWLDRN